MRSFWRYRLKSSIESMSLEQVTLCKLRHPQPLFLIYLFWMLRCIQTDYRIFQWTSIRLAKEEILLLAKNKRINTIYLVYNSQKNLKFYNREFQWRWSSRSSNSRFFLLNFKKSKWPKKKLQKIKHIFANKLFISNDSSIISDLFLLFCPADTRLEL